MSEALLFAEHGENMLCTKIVLNVRNTFCTQHVLPRFELGIFMYWTCNSMNNLLSVWVSFELFGALYMYISDPRVANFLYLIFLRCPDTINLTWPVTDILKKKKHSICNLKSDYKNLPYHWPFWSKALPNFNLIIF